MKKIINVTDITEYLYCPRKVYLRLVKGIRGPPNMPMILGMLRHKVFDVFNKNEQVLVSGIRSKLNESEISSIYEKMLQEISNEIYLDNKNLASSFSIDYPSFLKSVKETMTPEINLRVQVISSFLNLGFLGKELWRNLKPKYLTEFKLESQELGLRGRIDRVKFEDIILPYEIKTREQVYFSDKIQLAAYALLLENEFGKKITRGIVEFKGKQEEVDLNEDLKSQVLKLADEIREMKEGIMPSNFEKCKKCSLKEECLS